MKNYIRLIITLFIPLQSFSQSVLEHTLYSHLATDCGRYDAFVYTKSYASELVYFPLFNDDSELYARPMMNQYRFPDTATIPPFIIDINKNYLMERVGKEFFKTRVVFRRSETIDMNQTEQYGKIYNIIDSDIESKLDDSWFADSANLKNDSIDFYSLKRKKDEIKYSFEYYFEVEKGLNFYFATVYDVWGHLISKDQIPDVKKNKEGYKIISLCEAQKIAESDKKYKGELTHISLKYEPNKKIFVWEIGKPILTEGDTRIYPQVTVNAQTGKIIDRKKEKVKGDCHPKHCSMGL
jgi:uncharacterized membrane protein YkoI